MIEHHLDQTDGILTLRPKDALAKEDFEQVAKTVEPFLSAQGKLAGLIIEAPKFPGWENFGALVAHFKFVREHHKQVTKVAVVTDSSIGGVAEKIASHFVAAEIKSFPAGQAAQAKQWILGRG